MTKDTSHKIIALILIISIVALGLFFWAHRAQAPETTVQSQDASVLKATGDTTGALRACEESRDLAATLELESPAVEVRMAVARTQTSTIAPAFRHGTGYYTSVMKEKCTSHPSHSLHVILHFIWLP